MNEMKRLKKQEYPDFNVEFPVNVRIRERNCLAKMSVENKNKSRLAENNSHLRDTSSYRALII